MSNGDGTLAGKVALVTGAASNLPAVIARELAAAGATVALNGRTHAGDIQELATDIARKGPGEASAFIADVSKSEELRRMIDEIHARWGGVDILVNGAGPFTMKPYLELAESEWDWIVNTNLKAVYLAARSVAPTMIDRSWGRIISISAGSAYVLNHSAYSLAKASVNFLTQQLALELGPAITVNAIAPGQVAESAEVMARYDPTFVSRAVAHSPAGRLVTRQEVARMVVLLCTPAFDSVTGQVLRMDGGWSLPRF